MSEFTHMSWDGSRCWSGISSPFFLGVVIGLLLRIKLWHMLGLAFVAVGSLYSQCFASADFRFRPSGSFFPCADVLSSCGDFFGSHAPRGFPFFSLPSFRKAGWGGGSRDALVLLPEGLPLLPLDFCPARGVEEPLVIRSVHTSSLLSPRFIRGLGIRELLSCGGLPLPDLSRLVLPPHLCTPCEVMGRESLRGFLCSRLPLPPHLCMLCEVVRRESLPSSAPVRIPPWLPDLQLGKPGRCFEPALGRMALVIGLAAHAVAPLSVLGWAVVTLWAWIVSLAVFPCAVAVRLLAVFWPLAVFIAFALVVSVWPVAVSDR